MKLLIKSIQLVKSNFFLHFVNIFGSFASVQILVDKVSPDVFGTLGYNIAVARLTEFFVLAGLNQYGIQFIAEHSSNFRCKLIASRIQSSQIINIALAFLFLLSFRFFLNLNFLTVAAIIGLSFHHVIFPSYHFQALNILKTYTALIIFTRSILLVGLVYFITPDTNPAFILLLVSGSPLLAGFFNLILYCCGINLSPIFTLPRFYCKYFRSYIAFSVDKVHFLTSNMANSFFVSLPIILADNYLSSFEAGIYFAAERMMRIFHAILAPTSHSLYRTLCISYSENIFRFQKTIQRINRIYLITLPLVAAGMVYMSPFITRAIYPEEYHASSNVLSVLFIVIPFSFLWDLYGKQGFLISKLPYHFAWSNIVAILILCCFLIYQNASSVVLAIFYVLAEAGAYIYSFSLYRIHCKLAILKK